MHEARYTRADLLKILAQLRQQFEDSVRAFEQQQMEESVGQTVRLLEGMEDVLESLVAEYEKALFQYKFPRFQEVKTRLREMEKKKNLNDIVSEYTDTLITLNKYLAATESEIKKTYPRQNMWIKKIFKNKKLLGAGLVSLAFLIGVSIYVYHLTGRKYGLMGEYYKGNELSGPFEKRRDKKIDFNWGARAPLVGWRKDDFSIRWTGYLFVPNDGWTEILTQSDDGVRLWLGRDLVINNWGVHKKTTDRIRRELRRGYYPIRLEYFEKKKKSVIRLLWRRDRDLKPQVINADFLIHAKEYLDPKIPLFE